MRVEPAGTVVGVQPGTLGQREYTALVRNELDRWREVIRAASITVD